MNSIPEVPVEDPSTAETLGKVALGMAAEEVVVGSGRATGAALGAPLGPLGIAFGAAAGGAFGGCMAGIALASPGESTTAACVIGAVFGVIPGGSAGKAAVKAGIQEGGEESAKAAAREASACSTCGTAKPWTAVGSGAQSFVRTHGDDQVLKRLRPMQFPNVDKRRIPLAQRSVVAKRMAELGSRLRDGISEQEAEIWLKQGWPPDLVAKLRKGLGDIVPATESPRPGVLIQTKVEGKDYAGLTRAAKRVADEQIAEITEIGRHLIANRAPDGTGAYADFGETNFKFHPDGTVKHWFDPVLVYVNDADALIAHKDQPLFPKGKRPFVAPAPPAVSSADDLVDRLRKGGF